MVPACLQFRRHQWRHDGRRRNEESNTLAVDNNDVSMVDDFELRTGRHHLNYGERGKSPVLDLKNNSFNANK